MRTSSEYKPASSSLLSKIENKTSKEPMFEIPVLMNHDTTQPPIGMASFDYGNPKTKKILKLFLANVLEITWGGRVLERDKKGIAISIELTHLSVVPSYRKPNLLQRIINYIKKQFDNFMHGDNY